MGKKVRLKFSYSSDGETDPEGPRWKWWLTVLLALLGIAVTVLLSQT